MSYNAQRWVEIQQLHRTPKAVLEKVAGRAGNRTLECWPSQATLARDLGMSERTVRNALAYLEDQGFIERERQHRPKTGYRAQDRMRIRMEDVQTVVQTTLTYREFLAEGQPSLYAHLRADGSLPARNDGPTGKTCRAKNRKSEQEEASSTSSSSTTSSQDRDIRISVARENDEWVIEIGGLEEFSTHQHFQDLLGGIIEIGLDEGVSLEDLTIALQESWESEWVSMIDGFHTRVDVLRSRTNVTSIFSRTA